MIHAVKGFSAVNEAEVDVFMELSCFSCDPAEAGSLISVELSCFCCDPAEAGSLVSGSFAFSKSSLCIWNSSVHVVVFSNLIYVGLCMVFFMFFLNLGFSFSSDLETVWPLLFHTLFLHPLRPSVLQGQQGHTCWVHSVPAQAPPHCCPSASSSLGCLSNCFHSSLQGH